MFCIKCQSDVAYCVCPDIAERMRAIASHPAFAVKWCLECDKAVALCDCFDTGEERRTAFRTGRDEEPRNE